ncbi:DUF3025 domain-containing protein [Paludibacterium paludis]|uniref:DUF3025 domain-containing protein n=1 Tax=Paludibacterium paludis TaxID=1225769 RepID=A0A918P3E2_9NEIS|nr:DUF3025 domain-containing protein [Paludibacterium paludis]GGY16667.1 hypothetical protein GCM10011289_19990 [Paludibacterium paludis]
MADWRPLSLHHPLYAGLAGLVLPSFADWPDQAELDALTGRCASPVRFVLGLEPDVYYEQHIAQTGEVPTRRRNWHDWFNALAWLAWPRAKTALNRRHVRAIARGEVRRGPARDAATLLDESGILIPVSDSHLGHLIDQMRWDALFLEHRQDWGSRIGAFALGHALWETGLAPFIGWCGKALVVQVDDGFFRMEHRAQRDWLDAWLAEQLDDDARLADTHRLWPLPLLGIPGWCADNEDPAFYANRDYFRSSRRAKSSTVTS